MEQISHQQDNILLVGIRNSSCFIEVYVLFAILAYVFRTTVPNTFDHTQPECIAGEHRTGAIFCNTEKMYFPIVFDHRTVPLQSVETGRCRCLLDVFWEFIVGTLRIFGSCPSPFTNMKHSNRGRPPRKESRHVVWLTTSTLKLSSEPKRNLGFLHKSNSEFKGPSLWYCARVREKKQQVDRNPAAIIINKRVKEGNVQRTWSMLARCRISRIIFFQFYLLLDAFKAACIHKM